MAKRAWERGWPHFRGGDSIQEIFRKEQVAARAALLAEQAARRGQIEKDRDDARKQAIEARKIEGQMVSLARAGTLSGLAVVSSLVPAAKKLAEMVKKDLEATIASGKDLSASQAVHLLGRIVDLQVRMNGAGQVAMQMERLHLGQPTEIIGLTGNALEDDMTLEEAQERIKAAEQALATARRDTGSGFTVISGGKAPDAVSASQGVSDKNLGAR